MSEGKYCVYTHEANGHVFYVGAGRPLRAYSKEGRTLRWHQHVARARSYEVKIIRETEDRAEAIAIEARLIKELSPATNVRGKAIQRRPPYSFSVRLDADVRAALDAAAAAEDRQDARLARILIREGLRARGYLKSKGE